MHKIKRMAQFIFLRVISGLISISMIVLSIVSNGAAYAQANTVSQSTNSTAETTEESSITGNVDPTASVSTDTDKIRLIYQGDKDSLTDEDKIVAKYGDMYILEYQNSSDANQAKDRLSKDGTVDKEEIVRAATNSNSSEEETISTDSMNDSIKEADKKAVPDYSGKDVIALIDTGTPIKDDKDAVSFVDDDVMDRNGHAAVMSAAIQETAEDANILYLKALDDNGNGTTASVVAALDYAIKAHVSIINLSLSGKAGENTKLLESKIKEAVDAGIVVIGAAGNNGSDASDYVPANIDGVITVGACTVDGVKTPTSNYGNDVDWYVSAPSTSIASARATGFYYQDHMIKEQKNVCFKTVKIDQNIDASKESEMAAADAGGGGGGSGSAGGGYSCSVTWLLHDNNDSGFGWVYTNGGSSGTLNVAAVKNAIKNSGHPIYDLGRTPTTTTLITNSLKQAVNECRSNYKKLYGTEAGFKPRIVGIGFAWVTKGYHDYNETTNQTDNSVWNSAWNNINPTLYHNKQSYNKNTKSHNSSISLSDYATSRLNAYNNIRIIVLDDTEPMPAKGNIKISKSIDSNSDKVGTLEYNSFGTDIGYQNYVSNNADSGVLNQTGPMITSYKAGSIYGFNIKAPQGLKGTGSLQFRGQYAYEGWDQAFDTSTKKKYEKWYTAGGKEMSIGAVQMLDAAGDANNNPSGSGVQTYAWAPKGGNYADADAGWKSSEWNLKYDSDGYAILYNVSNPKVCLNQYGGKKELTKTTSKVVIYNYDGTDACKWKIERTSDGAYVLRSKADPNYYINVANNKHASSNGLPVQLYNSGKGEASMKADKANRWNFFKVSDNETDLSIPMTDEKLPEGTYYIGQQDYSLEGIQMKLTGDWATNYDVYYQAYVDGSGWQEVVRNGETAGTIGESKNILAYRSYIVPKSKSVDLSATKGAVYTVYSDETCTTKVGEITLDETGEGELSVPAQKTYYVKETTAPSGLQLDSKIYSVKVTGGDTTTQYVYDTPIPPSISTVATINGKKEIMILSAGNETLNDVVSYKNLKPGQSYTLKGEIHDVDSGKSFDLFSASKTFTPASTSGTTTVSFNINPIMLFNLTMKSFNIHRYVVYETLFDDNGNEIASHKDLSDTNQTVTIMKPTISTVATIDNEKKAMTINANVPLKDVISYDGLLTRQTYTIKSELINKSTGKAVTTSTSSFVPTNTYGSVTVSFDVNPKALGAGTYVVYETLTNQDGTVVATHKDLSDTDQTITILNPSISTVATIDAKKQSAIVNKNVPLKDVITYSNVIAGKTYTIKSELINKISGKSVVSSSSTFTPTSTSGNTSVSFDVNPKTLGAGTYVVYETLTDDQGREVSSHKDLNDTNQTVSILGSMSTSASISGFTVDDKQSIKTDSAGHKVYSIDDGTKVANVKESDLPKIQDTIHYEGLEVGKRYLVKSYLYDKETGQPIGLASGADVLSNYLTPEKENGDFTVIFDKVNIYNQSLYKERKNEYPYYRNIVIYEEIIDLSTGETVISHKDQKDEAQSLYLQIKNPRTEKKGNPLATTGGTAGWMLIILAMLGGTYAILKDKKEINE